MRVAKRVTLQLHQILHLPRKMNVMINPPHIWKVIYNALSSKSHPPTSPNIAPATQNNCQQWSASHMKRHFQCAERKSHPATSANTALATQNECHDWSCSRMKRHVQCAEQQASPSHLTKYCACHAKWMSWLIVLTYETSFPISRAARVTLQLHQILPLPCKWMSWLILLTYETSFTLRRAARVTLQRHQILPLPCKMNVMIDPAHVWNVIYNARSNRHHPPTSPNTAPATQNSTPKS